MLLDELIAGADVVVDNFRAGMLERHGVSPDEWCARRPELVWCTITGFGAGVSRPGYDFVTQAECGWMAITGEPDGDPMKIGVAVADVLAGKDAVIAILAALFRRERNGVGGHVVISLADSARAALVNVAQNALLTGQDARRWGNAHPNLVPYQLFRAADRPIVIAVGTDAQWVACARGIGLTSLADDPALASNAGRLGQRERIASEFTRQLALQPAAFWRASLDAVGVPNGVVQSVLETLRDTDASPLTGLPSSVGGTARFAPPGLDEHGTQIRELGWGVFNKLAGLKR
jgi:crotonobetainyl-CoA:carnitine CoA-transferase CaiB-like acyl-CoA transferase